MKVLEIGSMKTFESVKNGKTNQFEVGEAKSESKYDDEQKKSIIPEA